MLSRLCLRQSACRDLLQNCVVKFKRVEIPPLSDYLYLDVMLPKVSCVTALFPNPGCTGVALLPVPRDGGALQVSLPFNSKLSSTWHRASGSTRGSS